MDPPTEQIQSELESFRKQWQAEVSARSTRGQTGGSSSEPSAATSGTTATTSSAFPGGNRHPGRGTALGHKKTGSSSRGTTLRGIPLEDEDGEFVQARAFDEPASNTVANSSEHHQAEAEKEPETALDFYERAVEREMTGKLGDSLQLYRKAYRMDSAVDQDYKTKHFQALWAPRPKTQGQQRQSRGKGSENVSSRDQLGAEAPPQSLPLPDLIASFSGLSIEGNPPEMEGMQPPPCPIADVPDEILCHILRDVAILDIGDFARLSRVCRRLAYLVATEEQIWRRVCVGDEFGFGAMHYDFALGITWEPLPLSIAAFDSASSSLTPTTSGLSTSLQAPLPFSLATTRLLHSYYASSWRTMFRHRPRLRFNGCYISTVNYIREGQASGHTITWNSPVHVVTYYRYLRFFRDGSCISLLTTDEPSHVVHHLTKPNVELHAGGAHPGLPSAVMKAALKGRWHMSSYLSRTPFSLSPPEAAIVGTDGIDHQPGAGPLESAPPTPADLAAAEGDVHIETEGVKGAVGQKYIYRMELSLGNSGMPTSSSPKRARNNKLLWKEFWSYNKLTDDWAEFGLRHYQPFMFSRVKSYGAGE